jgi:toxin ParE1/3/4
VNVAFHDDAEKEYIAAVVWYELDYPGRGERFRDAIERTLSSVAADPLAFAVRIGVRAALVPQFPYVVFFEIQDTTTIRVLAVAHGRRRPGYWRERR